MLEGQEGSEGTSNEVTEGSTGAEQTGNQPNTSEGGAEGEKVQGEGETVPDETQNEQDLFVEKDGKQFIPKERFDQIRERMKKSEEAAKLLDTLRNDPDAAKQFLEEIGLGKENSPAQTDLTPTVTPVMKFISESVPKESQAHYQAFAESIAEEVASYIQEQLKPYRNWLGQSRLKEVESKVPDFNKYSSQVARLMSGDPHLSVENAYKIAAFDDRFNAGKQAGVSKVDQHKKILTKTPNKNPASSSASVKAPVKNFGEAFNRAWDKNEGA